MAKQKIYIVAWQDWENQEFGAEVFRGEKSATKWMIGEMEDSINWRDDLQDHPEMVQAMDDGHPLEIIDVYNVLIGDLGGGMVEFRYFIQDF
jgi:hypothetical protein